MVKRHKKISILIYSNEDFQFYNKIVDLMNDRGHKVKLHVFSGRQNLVVYIKNLIDLFKVDFKKFNLIHAYFGTAGFLATIQRKIPVITTYCGSDLLGVVQMGNIYNNILSILLKLISYIAYSLSCRTTTVSKRLAYELPNIKKNTVITLSVDTDHFRPMNMLSSRKSLRWRNDEYYILFPAEKFRKIKQYYIAENIIKNLNKRHNKINLVSLDKPNMYPILPNIMNACNAMIVVSFHEGSPNVIREAMACNLPIFSFDAGDVQEQTLNITPGIVVKQNDTNTLIQALDEFLSRMPLVRSNGRNKMISHTWENYIDKIEELYYEVARVVR